MLKTNSSTIKRARYAAYRLLALQLLVAVFVALLFQLHGQDKRIALSALAGSLVCILPSFYFARKALGFTGAQVTAQIVKQFYRAEMVKLMLTALMFALAMRYLPLAPAPFFVTYILVQMVVWLSPLFF